MEWRALFLSPKGRISRKDFWCGLLILYLIGIPVRLVLDAIPVAPSPHQVMRLIALPWIYSGFCIVAKRLHDIGRPGWLVMIPYAALLIAALVLAKITVEAHEGHATNLAYGAVVAVMAGSFLLCTFLLWVGLSAGESGVNRYGARSEGEDWTFLWGCLLIPLALLGAIIAEPEFWIVIIPL
jgi:uncharacterized membrane protein YhaH (DUF805 family)